jgi:hypothetical protein
VQTFEDKGITKRNPSEIFQHHKQQARQILHLKMTGYICILELVLKVLSTSLSSSFFHLLLICEGNLRFSILKTLRITLLKANFEHFWLVVWPQVTNKCYNIDVRILINAETSDPSVANWPPKFNGISIFPPWGQYKAIKFSIYY